MSRELWEKHKMVQDAKNKLANARVDSVKVDPAAAERLRFAKAGAEARWSKPRKYRNKPVDIEGVGHFDSEGEAERYLELTLLERSGAIKDLRRQVGFALTVNGELIGQYFADFTYLEFGKMLHGKAWLAHQQPKKVVEDFKSPASRTELYQWKKKHLLAEHGIVIFESGS